MSNLDWPTSLGNTTFLATSLGLWIALTQDTRNIQSINEFKNHIKNWNDADCTYYVG